jgi:alpha-tubulin suppressor-like RCC1 family protein
MIRSSDAISILLAAPLAVLSACSSPSSSAGAGTSSASEPTGQVSLAITTVPAGVQCIQVTATGSTTVSQTFSVTPDAGTVSSLALGELPIGSVVITAQAYSVACASIATASPSWVADTQTVTVVGGQVPSLTITFRPDNAATATANFVANVASVDIGADAIGIVMSDGTVRGAGSGPQTWVSTGNVVNLQSTLSNSNVSQMALCSEYGTGCLLLKTGAVQCWGDNTVGELGIGLPIPSTDPTPVTSPYVANATQICAGAGSLCALEASGTAFCWGYNNVGQVGNGNAGTNEFTPVQVAAGVSSIACGYTSTCAIANGGLECWGSNAFGQLGLGTTQASYSTPQLVTSLNAVRQVAAGYAHTCAVRVDGTLYCWGDNNYGQLGIGNTTNQSLPTVVSTLSNVQQVALGGDDTCARRGDGTVWCWGLDADGEVGDGTGSTSITSPVQVKGIAPSTSIVAGMSNMCSIGTDSTINCWGYNFYGQLGNGTTNDAFAPTPLTL